MTTEEMHARLDALTWVGAGILTLAGVGIIAILVMIWRDWRKK